MLVWGWGHITLGDRRGWILVVLQPLAILGWLFAAWQLIDGTRWLAVFVPLVLLLVLWVGQAVHAYRRALALGGAPGGELTLALFLPLVLALFTAFWLLGGRHGSAASTVEAYIDAWQSNRPDLAVNLYREAGIGQADVSAFWQTERAFMTNAIVHGQTLYGPASGLDADEPFNSLRVTQTDSTTFSVEIVRSETFQTTLLGLISTSGQRTVVVAPVMWIIVVEEAAPGALPSSAWRIDHAESAKGN
ncbi:MAG: hypothetical protein ABI725_03500 [Chloroflexota bacterium]